MGGAFDIMIWQLSVIFLLSGFPLALLAVYFLGNIFKKIHVIQVYRENFTFTYPLSVLLLLLFQVYVYIENRHYFTSLASEIPSNIFYVLIFLLSFLPLLFFFIKKNKRNNLSILIVSLALLITILTEQLYPFFPLDTYVLKELLIVVGKSFLWFIGLGLLLTLSVLFRKRMEKK